MSLEKRDGSPYWQIRFRLKGRKVDQSSGTTDRKKAEALEEKLRRAIWDAHHGDGGSLTWADACSLWEAEKQSKRSIKRDSQILALAGHVWHDKLLADITEEDVADYGRTVRKATSVGNAQRHLAMLRAFFNAMYRWKKIRLPLRVELPSGPKFEPKVVLRPDDVPGLMRELAPHLVPFVTFALETGLRFSNVAKLRWEPSRGGAYLDVAAATVTIPPPSLKTNKALTIPLSTLALDTVRDLERSPSGYVFVDQKGRGPMRSIKTGWHSATTKAGLDGLRVHDLRHAWASWHARAGTPSRILQDLGGWASEAMLRRYTHLNVADLRQYVK